jgi:hypothetical protein
MRHLLLAHVRRHHPDLLGRLVFAFQREQALSEQRGLGLDLGAEKVLQGEAAQG